MALRALTQHLISVNVKNWVKSLIRPGAPGAPGALKQSEATAQILGRLLRGAPWCMDEVTFADGVMEIGGWAIAPDGDFDAIRFHANGAAFQDVSYPRQRDDLERLYWFLPHGGRSGFRCRTRLSRAEAFRDGHLEIDLASTRTGRPLDDNHTYYFLDPLSDRLPFPEPERRQRVHGSTAETAFRLEGFSTFMKIRKTLRRHGHELDDGLRILDWGCGCGRLSRYFGDLTRSTLTGVDIDADNVGWCARGLPFGQFSPIPTEPPTRLAGATFDLIIGISIFTHLREPEQFAWLQELRRLAAPGALVMVSTHGDATVCRAGFNDRALDHWLANGFFDSGRNPTLDGVTADVEYYRNIFHTRDYIERRWSEYFRIIDFVPGYIGNHQDLVVMTPA